MKTKKLQQIENQINKIKMELHKLGEMRPGSLSRQYKIPKKQIGHYYQLSYTHKMKSRTEYIRSEFVNEIKQQVATYKRFKKLMEKWIDLAIEHSRLKMKFAKSAKSK
jgi:hypothetical protein